MAECPGKTGTVRKRLVSACARTRMCKYFRDGLCQRGEECSFAHSPEDLRKPPNMQRTRLCKHWKATGTCASGANCAYAHGVDNLRDRVIELEDDPVSSASPTLGYYLPFPCYEQQTEFGNTVDEADMMPCIEAGSLSCSDSSVMQQPEDAIPGGSSGIAMYYQAMANNSSKEHLAVFGDAIHEDGWGTGDATAAAAAAATAAGAATQGWPARGMDVYIATNGYEGHGGYQVLPDTFFYDYEGHRGYQVLPGSGLVENNVYSGGGSGCLPFEACTSSAPEAWRTDASPGELHCAVEELWSGRVVSF
eukprot:TRINITY_DN121057_c0_g1_i1.p1 TRINITY_DN121057_c0_g1~~TRINITY_DN121057_c0_g1_i1.p1  ORF type:complete len:306 (+),score=29.02 TRINITY_DN121057_c0_g1_i1:208-1125(+)